MSITPDEIVSGLGITTQSLDQRIGCVEEIYESGDKKIIAKFLFLKLRDGLPTTSNLVEIALDRIINYVLPLDYIERILSMSPSLPAMDGFARLYREARRLFLKSKENDKRSGELGELLLYMLTENFLKAPLAACKMFLKTNRNMPIHGTDGLHLGLTDGILTVYWGESKLHKKLSSGLNDIAKSVKVFRNDHDKYKNEIRIISNNLNIPEGNKELIRNLSEYFDPYGEKNNEYRDVHNCLAGYDSEVYKIIAFETPEMQEEKIRKYLSKNLRKVGEDIVRSLSDKGLTQYRFAYFILPFESVQEARDLFSKQLKGE